MYRPPVRPPSSQPFSLPFPPATKPPIKRQMNEIAVMIKDKDDSFNEVNFNSKEKIKLKTAAMT